MDDVDLGIGEERVQVLAALRGRAGDEVVPPVDSRRELDAVALGFPPLDAAEEIGAVLPRARGSRDADRAAVGKGAGEEGGRFQRVNLTASRTRVRRWVEGRCGEGRPDWAQIRTRRVTYIEYYGSDHSTPVFREYYRIDWDGWQLRNLLHHGDATSNPDLSYWNDLIRLYATCAGSTCPGEG